MDTPISEKSIYVESADRPAVALPARTLLDGKYRLGRVLGHGGFGLTYLAWDVSLATPVAIKEYLPRDVATRSPGGREVTPHAASEGDTFAYGLDRFLDEARTLAQFDHPNVVQVRAFFEEYGTGYLVMAYYAGRTLAQKLEEDQNPLREEDALQIMDPVLDGLSSVHDRGLIHRDVKPQNIYLGDEGRVILLDFGAARHSAAEHSRSLSVQLTAGYAPLEQYSSRGDQGPWTDVYGVSATLYRMLTGQTPPEATSRVMDHARLEPASESGVSDAVSSAIHKGMAISTGDRFASITAFRAALHGEPPVAEPHGASVNPSPEAFSPAHSTDATPSEPGVARPVSDESAAPPSLSSDADVTRPPQAPKGNGRADIPTPASPGSDRTRPPQDFSLPSEGNAPSPPQAPPTVSYGPPGKRFLAYLVDSLVVGVVSFIVAVGAFVLLIVASDLNQEPDPDVSALIVLLSGIGTSWLYFAGMESSTRRATLGKSAMDLNVTDASGRQLDFVHATGRYFGKLVSGAIAGIGYLMILFTKRSQGLHDVMAGTLVVEDGSFPETETNPSTRPVLLTGGALAVVGALLVAAMSSANVPPTAYNDRATTFENAPVTIEPLDNDDDPDLSTSPNERLSIAGFTQPLHGTVTRNDDELTYQPSGTYWGEDSFTYTVRDRNREESTATVTVTVEKSPERIAEETSAQANEIANRVFTSNFLEITRRSHDVSSVLFVEPFSDNERGWPTYNKPNGSYAQVENGRYYAEQRAENMAIVLRIDANHANFIARYDLMQVSGDVYNGAGLLFRSGSSGDYRLSVNGNGSYSLEYYDTKRWNNLKDWSRAESLKKGLYQSNRVELRVTDDRLVVYFNGEYEATLSLGNYRSSGSELGFFVGSFDRRFAFDNLVVMGLAAK